HTCLRAARAGRGRMPAGNALPDCCLPEISRVHWGRPFHPWTLWPLKEALDGLRAGEDEGIDDSDQLDPNNISQCPQISLVLLGNARFSVRTSFLPSILAEQRGKGQGPIVLRGSNPTNRACR